MVGSEPHDGTVGDSCGGCLVTLCAGVRLTNYRPTTDVTLARYRRVSKPEESVAPETEKLLFDLVNAAALEAHGGWTRLATVERLLLSELNQFDPRAYGVASLGELLNSSRCSILDGEHRRPEFEARPLLVAAEAT